MCKACDAARIPLNPRTTPQMLVEATNAAIQSAKFTAMQHHHAALGLVDDMSVRWGRPGVARMMWVWATGMQKMPRPSAYAPALMSFDRMRTHLEKFEEEVVTDAMVTTSMNQQEQDLTLIGEMISITAKPKKFARLIEGLDIGSQRVSAVTRMMMQEVGIRLEDGTGVEDYYALLAKHTPDLSHLGPFDPYEEGHTG